MKFHAIGFECVFPATQSKQNVHSMAGESNMNLAGHSL